MSRKRRGRRSIASHRANGLAFDGSLLGGVIVGTLTAVAAGFLTRGGMFHRPTSI